MTKRNIVPVIMSGGSGTRLWPLSTTERPKQFHVLGGAYSMIAETARRVEGDHGDVQFLPPVVIAGEAHAQLVDDLLAEAGIRPSRVVLEPMGRNTAATAALAAMVVQDVAPGADVLLLPADHVVTRPAAFHAAIQRAGAVVDQRIVTFGILPDRPETGFGYILQGEMLADGVFAIQRFTEKPKRDVAEAYLREGGYSWNSGVFYFTSALMLEEFSGAAAAIREGAQAALAAGRREGARIFLDRDLFAAVPAQPVDIAVMEKTQCGAVAPCEIGWADIGSWSEYWRLADKDASGNAHAGSGSTLVLDGANNLVLADGVHVSIAGVNDLIVVATRDAVIVLPKDRAQDVKALIPVAR
jgi:mannose-1-phosphate guanylyltransferase/mannose-6-phosphate isomerase